MDSTTTIIPVKLESGTVIRAEATVVGGKEEDVADLKLPRDIGDLTEAISGVSESVLAALRKVQPKKASVEFGVEVAVEAGHLTALLVRGSGNATIKVTLEWSRDTPPPGQSS